MALWQSGSWQRGRKLYLALAKKEKEKKRGLSSFGSVDESATRRLGWATGTVGPGRLLLHFDLSWATRYFSLVINNGKLSENTVSQKLSEVVQFWSQHYFYHFCFSKSRFIYPQCKPVESKKQILLEIGN